MEKGFVNILTFDLEEWHHLLDIKLDLTEKQRNYSILAAFMKIYWKSDKNTKQLFFA